MKIYQIAGEQYAAQGDNLYKQVLEFSSLQEPVVSVTATPELPLRRKYKTRPTKLAKAKKGGKGPRRGAIHCKVCDGYGHFAKTCPKRQGMLPPDEPAARPEITKDQVDELRAKGLDSLRIAAALHTTLTEVNKHW